MINLFAYCFNPPKIFYSSKFRHVTKGIRNTNKQPCPKYSTDMAKLCNQNLFFDFNCSDIMRLPSYIESYNKHAIRNKKDFVVLDKPTVYF